MIDDVRDALKELEKMPILRRGRSKASPSKYPANSIFAIADNKKWFQSVVRRSSINKFRWHDLRHTFISRLVQVRVNLKVVQEAARSPEQP